MKAKNENEIVDFEVNLKGSESEIASLAESEKKIRLFNVVRPEGNYCLDLEVVYDKLVFQQLLDLSLEAAQTSQSLPTGAFEQKACFNGVKLNGKANWNPPDKKSTSGLWDLKDTPDGRLEFYFTIDPVAYK